MATAAVVVALEKVALAVVLVVTGRLQVVGPREKS